MDELSIVSQGLNHDYTDAHSPLLVRLWEVCSWFKKGPSFPYLIALMWTLCGAAYILSKITSCDGATRIALIVLILLPPVFVSLGLATKDLFFAGSMLTVLASLNRYVRKQANASGLLFLASAQIAVLLRVDALFSLVPLVLTFTWLAQKKRALGLCRRALLAGVAAIILAIVMFACTSAFNRYAFQAKPWHDEQVFMLYDLSAISVQANHMLVPASRFSPPTFTLDQLRARLDASAADRLIWPPDDRHLIYTPGANQNELHHAWLYSLKRYPLYYLRHRLEYLAHYLGVRTIPEILLGNFQSDSGMIANNHGDGWSAVQSTPVDIYHYLAVSTPLKLLFLSGIWPLIAAAAWYGLDLSTKGVPDTEQGLSLAALLIFSAISYTLLMGLPSAAALGRYAAWPRIACGVVIAAALGNGAHYITEVFRRHLPGKRRRVKGAVGRDLDFLRSCRLS